MQNDDDDAPPHKGDERCETMMTAITKRERVTRLTCPTWIEMTSRMVNEFWVDGLVGGECV